MSGDQLPVFTIPVANMRGRGTDETLYAGVAELLSKVGIKENRDL